MLACVPSRTSVPVPLPVTVTPLPEAAVRMPPGTPSVTRRLPLPASTSPICRPVMPTAVSSFVVQPAGSVLTGASLTGPTLTVEVTVFELAAPSLTVQVTVRAAADGSSEVLAYCTARSAACHCAVVAVLPAELSDMTPVAAL
jgi:hypothetical protein